MAIPAPRELPRVRIAAIGASAGGITATQELLRHLPAKVDFALVIVQHLPPGQPSRLAQVVQAWTPLPVEVAADGVAPQPGHIYIPLSEHLLAIEDGVFRTRPLVGGGRRPGLDSIDTFLESLAAHNGRDAIAVVLSGTGSDGALGALVVRQAGGLVLVQDPVTALHDGMPKAAIACGAADRVLPLAGIAADLAGYVPGARMPGDGAPHGVTEVARTLEAIIAMIRQHAGFDLSGYKPTPLIWRIQQRMAARGTAQFAGYEALLREDPGELEALVRGMPIHVTEFFRDAEAWAVLAGDVVAPLARGRAAGETIRAWSAACASGEEAYSLAMTLAEQVEAAGTGCDFRVFATDAAPEIVMRASRGTFPERALKGLSRERKERFFHPVEGGCRIRRALRDRMVFAPQDLLLDPPFTELDLIGCRNLLIYLEPAAARRVLYLLHSALRMGGHLFLGGAEPLPVGTHGFEAVSSRWHIYRKVGAMPRDGITFPTRPPRSRDANAVESAAHRAAIEHGELPSVMVDSHGRILRVYGDAGDYLRIPPGQPTHDLLEVCHPSLAPHVRAATARARREGRYVGVQGLPDPRSGEFSLGLRVTPLQPAAGDGPRMLVSFVPHGPRPEAAAAPASLAPMAAAASTEELDASREELQALNEELKASNEQLNLSNEGLNGANVQLHDKIGELEMQGRVLSSGAVATLFIDEEKRVRWFTPAVTELFPLTPGDRGRPLGDIVQRFDDPAFFSDVEAVMRTGEPREAEVRTGSGRWYLRRIRPFVTAADVITGVAANFVDVTDRKAVEQALRATERRLATVFEGLPVGVALVDRHGRVERCNAEFRRFVQGGVIPSHDPRQATRWRARDADGGQVPPEDHPGARALRGETVVPGLEMVHTGEDGIDRWARVAAMPLADAEGHVNTAFVVITDIEAQKRLEQVLRADAAGLQEQVRDHTAQLQEGRDMLKATMDSSMDMIQVFQAVRDERGEIVDFRWVLNNHAAERAYGDVIGQSLLRNNPGVVAEGIFETFKRVVETGVPDQTERHYAHEQFDGWFRQSTVKLGDGVATTTADITGRNRER